MYALQTFTNDKWKVSTLVFTLFYNVYWEKTLKNSVYVGSWPCDLAYPRCPPGLHPKSVFAHQSVRKREKKKQRVSLHAHCLLLAPFIFSGTHQTCLMAVVDTVPLVVATISKW